MNLVSGAELESRLTDQLQSLHVNTSLAGGGLSTLQSQVIC